MIRKALLIAAVFIIGAYLLAQWGLRNSQEIEMTNIAGKGKNRILLTEKHNNIRGLSFSPDGRLLAAGSESGRIYMWQVLSGNRFAFKRYLNYGNAVTALCFSPDGKQLAVVGMGDVIIWDTAADKRIRVLKLSPTMNLWWKLAYSSDGRRLVLASRNDILIYDLTGNGGLLEIHEEEHRFSGIAVSPDNKTLAVYYCKHNRALNNQDTMINLYNIRNGRYIRTVWKRKASITTMASVAFSPDGSKLVAVPGGEDGILIFEVNKGWSLTSIPDMDFSGWLPILFNSKGTLLAVGSGPFSIWNLPEGKIVYRNDKGRFKSEALALAFSPDGETVGVSQFGFYER